MPHFGLMNADELGAEKAALQRARLHIRGGRRRLRQGKISAGIVTLYDALESALEWYFCAPDRRRSAGISGAPPRDSRTLCAILTGAGILDGAFDFDSFDALTEKALHEELPRLDWRPLLEGVEGVMSSLGIMPFDEEELPPEDPRTF